MKRLFFLVIVCGVAGPSLAEQVVTPSRQVGLHGEDWIHQMVFSPDGKQILAGCADGSVKLWDTGTGALLRTFQHCGMIRRMIRTHHFHPSIAFSPDGTKILTGGMNGSGILWNVADGKTVRTFSGPEGRFENVLFSPDGSRIAAQDRHQVMVWNTETSQLVRSIPGGGRIIGFSPDGRRILIDMKDGMSLCDVETGEVVRTLRARGYHGAFSPDGSKAIVGVIYGMSALWDLSTGDKIFEFQPHTSGLWCMRFSPDGKKIITGGETYTLASTSVGEARIWDAANGDLLFTLSSPTYIGSTVSAFFLPDGQSVLTAANDGSVLYWDISGCNEIDNMRVNVLSGDGF